MPVTSAKNKPLTGIADLPGFGAGQLQSQLQDETEEQRRKKLLGITGPGRNQAAPPILTPATTSLFQSMGLGRGSR